MSVYICSDCGEVSDESNFVVFFREVHDELPDRPEEWIPRERCPACLSENIEKADLCSFCGEYRPSLEIDHYGMCKRCREKTMLDVAGSVEMLIGFARENEEEFIDYVVEHRSTKYHASCN